MKLKNNKKLCSCYFLYYKKLITKRKMNSIKYLRVKIDEESKGRTTKIVFFKLIVG